MTTDSPLLDRRGVAELLDLTIWQVRGLERAGLPTLHTGERRVQFHRAEVLRWWQDGRRAEPAPPAVDARALDGAALTRLLAGGDVRLEVTIRLASERRRP